MKTVIIWMCLKRIKHGDELADWAVSKVTWMLGYGIANIIYIINPDCIIIGPDYQTRKILLTKYVVR